MDCNEIETAKSLLPKLKSQQTGFPQHPLLVPFKVSFDTYIAAFEGELEASILNCTFCDTLYMARFGASEGATSLVSATGMAAIILTHLNSRKRGNAFTNFEAIASYVRTKPGFRDVTQNGNNKSQTVQDPDDKKKTYLAAGTYNAYEGYTRFCQGAPDVALDDVNLQNTDLPDALFLARAIMWGETRYNNPVAAFLEDHKDEYWLKVYPLQESIEGYEDYQAVLDRLGLDYNLMDEIAHRPEIIYSHSYDSSIDENVFKYWKERAIEEARKKGWSEIKFDLPDGTTRTLEKALELGYQPQGVIPRDLQTTFYALMPGTETSPIYIYGKSRNLILSDNSNPLHFVWQYEQFPEDLNNEGRIVNYEVLTGHDKEGKPIVVNRKCNPNKVKRDTKDRRYVTAESCCEEGNDDSKYCKDSN